MTPRSPKLLRLSASVATSFPQLASRRLSGAPPSVISVGDSRVVKETLLRRRSP
jgi:hypothetical protein